ncbi:uncharacterized protein [Nicotiana sylvestris]|uniref:uncharacterized protein n=1 Tax=Nicotiana sylvestris TaxID=4096 RepID=UPI00388C7A65
MCSQLMISLFLIMEKIYMVALPFLKLGLHQERVVNNIILPCVTLQEKVLTNYKDDHMLWLASSSNTKFDMRGGRLEGQRRRELEISPVRVAGTVHPVAGY